MTILIQRREALQIASATALATWLKGPLTALADDSETNSAPEDSAQAAEDPEPLPYLDRIGLQLYTVRNQMAADPVGTLKAVADAGYKQVELMNIDEAAVDVAGIARAQGLMVHSAFMDFNAIVTPDREGVISIPRTIELAERIGLRHIVFGYITKDQRDTAGKCRAIADRANVAAEAAKAAGLRMCYHNHAFEFAPLKDGDSTTTAFDIFVKQFDPHVMEFELDVFWAKLGGRNPLAMMKRLAGRISQVHLKDLKPRTPVIFDESKVPHDAFEELGDGSIHMPGVMRLAKQIGVDQCHVEQDHSPAPLQSIAQSAQYLGVR